MLQSDQNENGKKTEDATSHNDNVVEDNQKDKNSRKEDDKGNDDKENDSQEIKAEKPKKPERVEAELLRMKEIAFLDFKDLKDPLPEASKFKKTGKYDFQPIDFWDFTEQMWAKVFYNL